MTSDKIIFEPPEDDEIVGATTVRLVTEFIRLSKEFKTSHLMTESELRAKITTYVVSVISALLFSERDNKSHYWHEREVCLTCGRMKELDIDAILSEVRKKNFDPGLPKGRGMVGSKALMGGLAYSPQAHLEEVEKTLREVL